MDTKEILALAKIIVSRTGCISSGKWKSVLGELKRILEEQGTPAADIALIDKMIASGPELEEMMQKDIWTEVDIEIASRRARAREAREEAMRYRGRC